MGGQQQLGIGFALGQHFARRVPQCLVPGPDQLFAPDIQARLGFESHQLLVERVILFARFLQGFFQSGSGVLQILGGRFAGHKRIDRFAQGAVPVLVETVSQLLGDRPDTEHVDVGEVHVGLGIEILVPQIAPADDGHAVVRQPQLVVHASVLLRQVEQTAYGARYTGAATQVQRVEHPNLNLWMRREGGDGAVQTVAGGVVEQNAYAHATVGGLEDFFHQHSRADAVVHDVVLQIEAGLGVANQLGAGREGFGAV
ncbi:hypothetical protein D3C71_1161220 [compost metagenome]